MLDVAAKSLALYGEKFGEYPYSTLSVVLNGLTGGVNGMEYPTLVMIAPEISLDDFEKMGLDLKRTNRPPQRFTQWIIPFVMRLRTNGFTVLSAMTK